MPQRVYAGICTEASIELALACSDDLARHGTSVAGTAGQLRFGVAFTGTTVHTVMELFLPPAGGMGRVTMFLPGSMKGCNSPEVVAALAGLAAANHGQKYKLFLDSIDMTSIPGFKANMERLGYVQILAVREPDAKIMDPRMDAVFVRPKGGKPLQNMAQERMAYARFADYQPLVKVLQKVKGQADTIGLCAVCADHTRRLCKGCQSVYFCCPEHLKQLWPDHKQYCKAWATLRAIDSQPS